jgi:hypothetical protein
LVDVTELVPDGQGLTQRFGRPLYDGTVVLGVRHVAAAMAEKKLAEVVFGVADRDFQRMLGSKLAIRVERLRMVV